MRFMIMVRATADKRSRPHARRKPACRDGVTTRPCPRPACCWTPTACCPRPGWRVQYDAQGERKVLDGPFAETKELIAGYTMIQAAAREEAMQWAQRFPSPFPGQPCSVDVRQLYELEDFAPSPAIERFRDIPGNGQQ